MRKLLLATVAALGASMGVATVADAQTASPEPGTVTVRLNGRFRFYGSVISQSDANNNASGTATGNVNVATGQGTAPSTNKQASYSFANFARLYPGFDGVAANGLKYGASLEIRSDNVSGAGGGSFGGVSQSNRARGELYLRREWGYIGTDKLGTLRFGSTDQPSSLYMTGNFENFDAGGFNGDAPAILSQNLVATWPFADVGNYYSTTKAIYLSPQLYGLDFGVSFEPGTGAVNVNSNCGAGSFVGANFVNAAGTFAPATGANGQGVAGPGCDQLSSSPSNAESGRRKNTVDALLRYRGTFGGFGIAATGGYIGGGHVLDNSGQPFTNNGLATGGVRPNYDGLNIGDFGVAVTYGGLSVGGKYMYGRYNGQWSLDPKGLRPGEAILGGASYTVGPLVVGVQYLNYTSAGDIGNANAGRNRLETGVAAGATYSLAPGLSLVASYLYSERRQSGYDFITGQGVSAAAPNGVRFNNKVTSQILSIGTLFSW